MENKPTKGQILYGKFGRDLYRTTGAEETDSILDILDSNPTANNSTNVTTSPSDVGSGVSSGIAIGISAKPAISTPTIW